VLTICWRQGPGAALASSSALFSVLRHNPGVFVPYLSNCALIEHFIQYRQIVRDEVEAQLAEFLAGEANLKTPEASPAVPKL